MDVPQSCVWGQSGVQSGGYPNCEWVVGVGVEEGEGESGKGEGYVRYKLPEGVNKYLLTA